MSGEIFVTNLAYEYHDRYHTPSVPVSLKYSDIYIFYMFIYQISEFTGKHFRHIYTHRGVVLRNVFLSRWTMNVPDHTFDHPFNALVHPLPERHRTKMPE